MSAMIDESVNIPSTNKIKNIKFLDGTKLFNIALFWRRIRLNNNSPRQGVVADIM